MNFSLDGLNLSNPLCVYHMVLLHAVIISPKQYITLDCDVTD